jgi:hypothetical protein
LNNPLSFVDPSGYSIDWGMTGYQATGAMMTTLLLLSVGVTPAALVGVFLITFVHSTTVAMMQGASIKAAAGYGLTSASMAVYSAAGTASIGDAFKLWVPKKGGMFLKELLIASSHGALQGGIRAAQGGKFEHGFYSGFVSSLGGSAMETFMEYPTIRVGWAAGVGGTAEWLGGGKFANGAVTGAFVEMLNHQGKLVYERRMKALALNLRYNPYALGLNGKNPFLGAEAIFVDIGGGFVGAEYDRGYFFVLAGDDYGQLIPYTEFAGGGALEASIGIEIGRVDLVDKSIPFQTEMLFGERIKGWGGAPFVGGAGSYSSHDGVGLISTSINIGISISPFGGFTFGGNKGLIERKR